MAVQSEPVTLGSQYKLGLAANTTNTTAFAAQIATTVIPATSSSTVIITPTKNYVMIAFFGTGANDNTLTGTIFKKKRDVDSGDNELWSPGFGGGVITATLSNGVTGAVGVTPNGTSDLFADTVAIGVATSDIRLFQGLADKTAAVVMVDNHGGDKIGVHLDVVDATDANIIWWEI